jgi:hypothetical protein
MKILDENVYINFLKRVKSYYKNERLIYIMHKHEADKKIEKIMHEVGMEIRRFDVPIEYQMSVRGDKPKILAGFSSSAIENCRIIFQDNIMIDVFYIEPEYFIQRKDYTKRIFDYYYKKMSKSFNIVKI